ncbi:MAG TPA: hypothetical protein VIJ06_00060, partial [Methylovirgula sp.]
GGVAVGGGLVGYLCAVMDTKRHGNVHGGSSRLVRLVYAIATGFVVIVMRGSLLGVIGPVLLGVFMAAILRRACQPIRRSNSHIAKPRLSAGPGLRRATAVVGPHGAPLSGQGHAAD